MMEKKECWFFVPETDNRFAISNFGRLMKVAKKRLVLRRTQVIAVFEILPLVASYKTGVLGWYVYYDNEKHFLARDELVKLIPDEVLKVDHSMDQAAIEKREATFNPEWGGVDDEE